MFPYHDDNRTIRPALITLLFIALNVLVWFLVEGAGSPLAVARSVCDLGLIPGALTGVLRPGARFPLGFGLAFARYSGNMATPYELRAYA